MGSFSWEYASETSPVINICPGDEIKVLIPEHFGVGEIVGTYEDYGIVNVGVTVLHPKALTMMSICGII